MKNTKSCEELLSYAQKMRLRGETYKTIDQYLSKYTDDIVLKKRILDELDLISELKNVEIIKPSKKKVFTHARIKIYATVLFAFMIYFYIKTGILISFLPMGILLFFIMRSSK